MKKSEGRSSSGSIALVYTARHRSDMKWRGLSDVPVCAEEVRKGRARSCRLLALKKSEGRSSSGSIALVYTARHRSDMKWRGLSDVPVCAEEVRKGRARSCRLLALDLSSSV